MTKFTSNITNDIAEILEGINKAASVIVSTMGGSGKNVILSDNFDNMKFTKDGVSVAKEIRLSNKNENIGAQLLINAANKTVTDCGDGTTLTSLLVKEFSNLLFAKLKKDPTLDINKMLDEAREVLDLVKQALKEQSTKIENAQDIYHIALTSSKSSVLANFIKEIFLKTGLDANISLEESRTSSKTYYELTEGLSFDSGMIHPGFANREDNKFVAEKPFVLIVQENVSDIEEYKGILEECLNGKHSIIMLAPSYSDNFVKACLTNKIHKGLDICLLRLPGYGSSVKENIRDIIAFINDDGTTNRAECSLYEFIIYNQADKTKIKNRVSQLKKMADSAVEEYDEKDYQNRIYRLNQTSAIIFVGGITQKNAKEEYDRLEDAIGAIKSSLKEGFVLGAGATLYNVADEISLEQNNDILECLRVPYRQILKNANMEIPKYTINDKELKKFPINTRTNKVDNNIIDSTHILINAIDNSFALVELLINTSYVVYNE